MAKYTVTFKGVTWATATVEADNEDEAIEAAFADGFPKLCAHCSGYFEDDWKLEIPDFGDGWDLDADGAGVSPAEMSQPEIRQQLRVPIRPGTDVVLYVPFPMSEADWGQFMAVLGAMKPGLVPEVSPGLAEGLTAPLDIKGEQR